MSAGPDMNGAAALKALLSADVFASSLGEKDFAAAAGLLTRKLMNAAGQTLADMHALRDAVGPDIFEAQLKSLTAHQARLLARRLDKSVPDIEVSTAGAACAFIRGLMKGETVSAPAEPAPEAPAPEPAAETAEPAATPAANPYFGRKSFRTGN
ncbi:MAG: hypothetical protein KDA53_03415 [Hyphomonas sp.]|nr:hypothetical protein [Hyphomonas sp.]